MYVKVPFKNKSYQQLSELKVHLGCRTWEDFADFLNEHSEDIQRLKPKFM